MVIRFISVSVIGAALLGVTLMVVAPQQSQAVNLSSASIWNRARNVSGRTAHISGEHESAAVDDRGGLRRALPRRARSLHRLGAKSSSGLRLSLEREVDDGHAAAYVRAQMAVSSRSSAPSSPAMSAATLIPIPPGHQGSRGYLFSEDTDFRRSVERGLRPHTSRSGPVLNSKPRSPPRVRSQRAKRPLSW